MTPFLEGTAFGLLATGAAIGAVLVGLGSAIATRPWARRTWGIPISGLAMAVPLAVVVTDGAPLGLLGTTGLGLLLIAGILVPRDRPPPAHGLAALPGAVLLGFSADGWAVVLVLIGVPVLVVALARFESGHREVPGLSGMAGAIAAGGAFLTVPDTEHVSLLAGAGVVVGLATLAQPALTLGASRAVWAGAFIWSVAIDGSPRAAGIVGAIGALGLLIVDPAVRVNLAVERGLAMYLAAGSAVGRIAQVAVVQTALAVFTARIAGLRTDVLVALALTGAAWVTTGYVLGRNAQTVSSGQGPV